MLQKFHRFQVLVSAIDIGHPLPILFSVIQIKHGGHRIHPDAVGVILVRPEQSIGNEEVGNLRPSVIIDQRAPMGMRALSGVLMLVDTGTVKTGKSVCIPWKMSRNPVQDDADSPAVHIIHKIHEIVRISVAAGRRIVARHLVSPGSVQGMLHHRKQLHMGIPHLFYIVRQQGSDFPVMIELRPRNILSLLILLERMAHPGAQMNLINQHRLFFGMGSRPLLHPLLVLPLIMVNVPDHRSRVGA